MIKDRGWRDQSKRKSERIITEAQEEIKYMPPMFAHFWFVFFRNILEVKGKQGVQRSKCP